MSQKKRGGGTRQKYSVCFVLGPCPLGPEAKAISAEAAGVWETQFGVLRRPVALVQSGLQMY